MDFTDKVLFPFPQKRTYPHLSLTPRGKQIPPNGKNVHPLDGFHLLLGVDFGITEFFLILRVIIV